MHNVRSKISLNSIKMEYKRIKPEIRLYEDSINVCRKKVENTVKGIGSNKINIFQSKLTSQKGSKSKCKKKLYHSCIEEESNSPKRISGNNQADIHNDYNSRKTSSKITIITDKILNTNKQYITKMVNNSIRNNSPYNPAFVQPKKNNSCASQNMEYSKKSSYTSADKCQVNLKNLENKNNSNSKQFPEFDYDSNSKNQIITGGQLKKNFIIENNDQEICFDFGSRSKSNNKKIICRSASSNADCKIKNVEMSDGSDNMKISNEGSTQISHRNINETSLSNHNNLNMNKVPHNSGIGRNNHNNQIESARSNTKGEKIQIINNLISGLSTLKKMMDLDEDGLDKNEQKQIFLGFEENINQFADKLNNEVKGWNANKDKTQLIETETELRTDVKVNPTYVEHLNFKPIELHPLPEEDSININFNFEESIPNQHKESHYMKIETQRQEPRKEELRQIARPFKSNKEVITVEVNNNARLPLPNQSRNPNNLKKVSNQQERIIHYFQEQENGDLNQLQPSTSSMKKEASRNNKIELLNGVKKDTLRKQINSSLFQMSVNKLIKKGSRSQFKIKDNHQKANINNSLFNEKLLQANKELESKKKSRANRSMIYENKEENVQSMLSKLSYFDDDIINY